MEVFEICMTLGMFLFIGVCWLKGVLVDLNYYRNRSEEYENNYHRLLLGEVDGNKQ